MRWFIFFTSLCLVLLSALPAVASDFKPLNTPFTSYSGGVGLYKYVFNYVYAVPVDYKYVGEKFGIGANLGYAYREEMNWITLGVPVTYKVGDTGPLRLNVGFDFINTVYLDYYSGTHGIGPLFSLVFPIPYNNSFNEFGISVPLGVVADENNAEFLVDIAIRESMQLMFNEKFGLAFGLCMLQNLHVGGYYYDIPARTMLYVGPCIRW